MLFSTCFLFFFFFFLLSTAQKNRQLVFDTITCLYALCKEINGEEIVMSELLASYDKKSVSYAEQCPRLRPSPKLEIPGRSLLFHGSFDVLYLPRTLIAWLMTAPKARWDIGGVIESLVGAMMLLGERLC